MRPGAGLMSTGSYEGSEVMGEVGVAKPSGPMAPSCSQGAQFQHLE